MANRYWTIHSETNSEDVVEAVLVASKIKWPERGEYTLRNVVYFESKDEAEANRRRLGTHRPNAISYLVPHYTDADYIVLHESPVIMK